jgi:hypothetical protein
MKTSSVTGRYAEASVNETERDRVMDHSTIEGFVNERDLLSRRLEPEEQSAARELAATLPDWREPVSGLGDKFIRMSTAFQQRFKTSTAIDINKFLVIDLALVLEARLVTRDLPKEVLALYPAASARLLTYVRNLAGEEYYFTNDYFLKDVCFASGLSVPCGAQVVDWRSGIGYRASARWLLRNPSPHYVGVFLRSGQIRPWFRIHTESRYLDDFNEPGWDACYLRIAALLRKHPEVLGMAGTSWFYDPQLDSISPRLSYLRLRPLQRGASVVRSGTTAFDISSATAKSSTRRQLYEEGKYLPVSYNLLWPRDALLAWADGQHL